jgi:hypothetical protein
MSTPVRGRSNDIAIGGTLRHHRSAERLVNLDRSLRPFGSTYVDGFNAMSQELADSVALKAMNLQMILQDEEFEDITYEGQVGMIRGERLAPSPEVDVKKRKRGRHQATESRFAVVPVTAKHNVMTIVTEDGDQETYRESRIFGAPRARSTVIVFPEGGWKPQDDDEIVLRPPIDDDDDVVWEFGVDITRGEEINDPRHFLTRKSVSYEKVDDEFNLVVGQKVGIAVFRRSPITHEDAGASAGVDLHVYFGRPNMVHVHTGCITRLSEDNSAFEHDINTFAGCSGAIVFLLDQNQNGLVDSRHFGKAIAVHVGGDITINRNFAFRI